jgi:hypothetical protein
MRPGTSRPTFLRTWLIWTAGFLAFRQLVDIAYRRAGQPHGKLRRLPPVLLRALGLIEATMRELPSRSPSP